MVVSIKSRKVNIIVVGLNRLFCNKLFKIIFVNIMCPAKINDRSIENGTIEKVFFIISPKVNILLKIFLV